MTQQNIFSALAPSSVGATSHQPTAEVSKFQFESYSVRVVVGGNGEPLFVGKDLCDALGYANPADAMSQHCKGVAKRYPLQTPGGRQEVRVLTEADMFRLIVNSTLPAAERFEGWVFEEVLPSIRKTGSYTAPGASVTPRVTSPYPPMLIETLAAAVDRGLMSKRSAVARLDALLGIALPRRAPRAEPAPVQLPLELVATASAPVPAPAPAPVPTPKPKPKPTPAPKVTIKAAPFDGFDGLNFILAEAGDYVVGGEPALLAAMKAHGLVGETGVPTAKGRGLVFRKGNRGYHWRLGELFRFLGATR